MKRFLLACLLVVLVCLISAPVSAASPDKPADLNVGDTFFFGRYEQDGNTKNGPEPVEWKVLDKEGPYLYLLSVYGLDAIPYQNKIAEHRFYGDSAIRWWMNNDFYTGAFTQSEKNCIKLIPFNQITWKKDVGVPVEKDRIMAVDYVALMNINLVKEYLKYDFDMVCEPSPYARKKVKKSEWFDEYGYGVWWISGSGDYAITSVVSQHFGIKEKAWPTNDVNVLARPVIIIDSSVLPEDYFCPHLDFYDEKISIAKNGSYQLSKPVVVNAISDEKMKYSWTSEDPAVVKVSGNKVKCISEGKTNLICEVILNDGSVLSKALEVKVLPAVRSFSFAEKTVTYVYMGDPVRLCPVSDAGDLDEYDIQWESSAPNCVYVDNEGYISTYRRYGDVTITATLQNGINKKASIHVDVTLMDNSTYTFTKSAEEIKNGDNVFISFPKWKNTFNNPDDYMTGLKIEHADNEYTIPVWTYEDMIDGKLGSIGILEAGIVFYPSGFTGTEDYVFRSAEKTFKIRVTVERGGDNFDITITKI